MIRVDPTTKEFADLTARADDLVEFAHFDMTEADFYPRSKECEELHMLQPLLPKDICGAVYEARMRRLAPETTRLREFVSKWSKFSSSLLGSTPEISDEPSVDLSEQLPFKTTWEANLSSDGGHNSYNVKRISYTGGIAINGVNHNLRKLGFLYRLNFAATQPGWFNGLETVPGSAADYTFAAQSGVVQGPDITAENALEVLDMAIGKHETVFEAHMSEPKAVLSDVVLEMYDEGYLSNEDVRMYITEAVARLNSRDRKKLIQKYTGPVLDDPQKLKEMFADLRNSTYRRPSKYVI